MGRRAFVALMSALLILGQLPAVAGAAPPTSKGPRLRPEVRQPVHSDTSAPLRELDAKHVKKTPPGQARQLDKLVLPKAEKAAKSGSSKGGPKSSPKAGTPQNGGATSNPATKGSAAPAGGTAATTGEVRTPTSFSPRPRSRSLRASQRRRRAAAGHRGRHRPDPVHTVGQPVVQVFDRAGTPLLLNDEASRPRPGTRCSPASAASARRPTGATRSSVRPPLRSLVRQPVCPVQGAAASVHRHLPDRRRDRPGTPTTSSARQDRRLRSSAWPDACYMTVNQFDQNTFAGPVPASPRSSETRCWPGRPAQRWSSSTCST
jgi:hypothetical protein